MLVRNYAEALGFEYISASNKEEFEAHYERFVDSRLGEHSIIFEVFTTPEEESDALKAMGETIVSTKKMAINTAKKIIPRSGIDFLKSLRDKR